MNTQEIVLKNDRIQAVLATYGASLRRLFEILPDGKTRDIIWGYSGSENKKGGQGDVLIPFPSRIKNGRYTFEAATHQMALNDKEGPNSIHGFLRTEPWAVEESAQDHVTFFYKMTKENYGPKGYPFDLEVRISYGLKSNGMTVGFEITNSGNSDAPVGVGFHPYFVVGTENANSASLEIPAENYLELDSTLIPTGRALPVENTSWDFRKRQEIGDRKILTCYSNLKTDRDGKARVRLLNKQNGQMVLLTLDDQFKYLVAYTGDAITEPWGRYSVALEPMTCAPDAFNHPECGLKVLSPNEIFTGSFEIESLLSNHTT